jgi:hypothetical protein
MRAAAIALAILAVGSSAAAAPAPALVDEMVSAGAAEAPIVVRIDPAALPSVRAFARSRVPWPLRDPFDDALGALGGALGGDPFTADGWRALGLDPTRPIVIAIGRTNGARVLAAQGERAPIVAGGEHPAASARDPEPLLVGVRAIVPVADPRRAAAAIARAQQLAPALAFGAPGKTLAIDLVLAPGPDGTDVVLAPTHMVEARSTRNDVLARLRAPAADVLAGAAPIALHVDPRRLVETGLWLRAAALGDRGGPRVDVIRASAAPIAPILQSSFRALGATVELHEGTATVHASLALVPRSRIATAIAVTRDSGLPRPADTPDAALHVHSYVAGLSALIATPGMMTYDLPSRPSFDPGPPGPLFDALAWPTELGATMSHVVDAEPRARGIFDGVGDAVLVAATIGPDLDHTAAALEVALQPDAAAQVRPLIDAVWGASRAAGGVTSWGAGRVRPFSRALPHGDGIGAALGDSAPAYLALTRAAPAPPAGVVLEVHAAPDALGLLDPIATFAGTLDLTARAQPAALAIDATLSP